MRIGAHVGRDAALSAVEAEGLDCVQIFLGDPQSWKKPPPRPDEAALRAAPFPVYVHAPYLVNVASPENRIRIPSRTILQNTCDAAVAIGAAAVIVHGGTVGPGESVSDAYPRWRKALEQLDTTVQLLIENTAGGEASVARTVDGVRGLFEVVGDLGAGFCLDTCHAHSAGIAVGEAAARFREATGRVDLVHCNDSRDPLGSGRDRHCNLGEGTLVLDDVAACVRAAGTDVIVETPAPGRVADVAWLRALDARG